MNEQRQGFNATLEAFGSGMQSFAGRGPKGYTRPNARVDERIKRSDERVKRADERIREDVCDRLTDDAWIDAFDIEVTVRKCEVTLTGAVCDRDQQRRAADVAEATIGVKHVTNSLRLAKSQGTDRSSQDHM